MTADGPLYSEWEKDIMKYCEKQKRRKSKERTKGEEDSEPAFVIGEHATKEEYLEVRCAH